MIPKIGPLELVIILVIVTMLFGVGRLPEVFGAVGRGVREFRRASALDDENDSPSSPAQASAESVDSTTPTTSAPTTSAAATDTSTTDTSADQQTPQA